jgi:hypothetical protein
LLIQHKTPPNLAFPDEAAIINHKEKIQLPKSMFLKQLSTRNGYELLTGTRAGSERYGRHVLQMNA